MKNRLFKMLGREYLNDLLGYSPLVNRSSITIPEDFISSIEKFSLKPSLKNLKILFSSGRLANTGYLSILPLDHGIEHLTTSFLGNPMFLDPNNMFRLASDTGCNAIVSNFYLLESVSKPYVDRVPMIVKMNHNDYLSNSPSYNQSLYSNVEQAHNLGAIGVAATLYLGRDTGAAIDRVREIFAEARSRGMLTILWAYLRNDKFKRDRDYHLSADLTGQANYVASMVGADIVKQKYPTFSGKFSEYTKMPEENTLLSDNPIDMVRYQVLNSFAGRVGLMNSGGQSSSNDLEDLARLAVINKLAGGMGIMAGRKIISKPYDEAVESLKFIQDIYLSEEIRVL